MSESTTARVFGLAFGMVFALVLFFNALGSQVDAGARAATAAAATTR